MRTVDTGVGWALLVSLALVIAGVALLPRLQLFAKPGVDGAWAEYVATTGTCPGGDDEAAAAGVQEATMLCLVNYARLRRGLSPVAAAEPLLRSAALKAHDISTCRRFDHDPCGRGAWSVLEAAGAGGYATAENIALVSAETASPRHVVHLWLTSSGHRENLFRPEWTVQGVALLSRQTVDGRPGMNVWVSHFGYEQG